MLLIASRVFDFYVFLADGVAVVQIGSGNLQKAYFVPVDVVGLGSGVASVALGEVSLIFCCLRNFSVCMRARFELNPRRPTVFDDCCLNA